MYIIDHIMIEMIVVIKNFLNICGLLGAPVSLPPSTFFSALSLMLSGSTVNKSNHQINKNRIIDPANPKTILLLVLSEYHYSLLGEEIQLAYHEHQF